MERVGYVAYTTDVYINLLTGVATDLVGFPGSRDLTAGPSPRWPALE